MGARQWAARGVAAARRRGVLGLVAFCVPLSSMLTVLATVTVCLCSWRSGPSYRPGLLFPAISELGVNLPEKRFYQVGFATCGGLLALGILLFEELASCTLLPLQNGTTVLIHGLRSAPALNGTVGTCQGQSGSEGGRWSVQLGNGEVKAVKPENLIVQRASREGPDGALLRELLKWGYLSAAGVVLQGILTLEHTVSAQCFVHWGGAVLFILGAMQHAKASNELYDKAKERKAALLEDRAVVSALKVRHIILDYSSVLLFMVPLAMQMLPSHWVEEASTTRSSVSEGEKEKEDDSGSIQMMNTMGVMQWGIILQFAVYFCTYTADLRAAVGLLPSRDAEN